MLRKLQNTCRQLLLEGKVDVVIGYGQADSESPTHPVFITDAKDVKKLVWNDKCLINLVTYLKRPEIKSLGKSAIVAKGCDERAIVVLEKESQLERDSVFVIGMACAGVGQPLLPKCKVCDAHMPQVADIIIGSVENPSVDADTRYAELKSFLKKSPEERHKHWVKECRRCLKCYACRQTCPMCYCERCIVDVNQPQYIDSSASTKGNFAWHITRAFHLAGRCVGCDECTRVCPVGIDLRLLNMSIAKSAEQNFEFRAGVDPDAKPIIGSYSEQDREDFIR